MPGTPRLLLHSRPSATMPPYQRGEVIVIYGVSPSEVPILEPEVALYPPTLFEGPEGASPWRVARVRSRQEKVLARHLLRSEVGYYLPLETKEVRRNGRRFVSHLPLFPGYVFFRGEKAAVLRSNVIVHLLEVQDQRLLGSELANLWAIQEAGLPLVAHPWLGPGDAVAIVDGPLKGWTGTVLREKGRTRLVVSVTFLRQSVAAELPRVALAPLLAAVKPGAPDGLVAEHRLGHADPWPIFDPGHQPILDALGQHVAQPVDLRRGLVADDDRFVAPGPERA
jgi:transcription antitermination factor NusG